MTTNSSAAVPSFSTSFVTASTASSFSIGSFASAVMTMFPVTSGMETVIFFSFHAVAVTSSPPIVTLMDMSQYPSFSVRAAVYALPLWTTTSARLVLSPFSRLDTAYITMAGSSPPLCPFFSTVTLHTALFPPAAAVMMQLPSFRAASVFTAFPFSTAVVWSFITASAALFVVQLTAVTVDWVGVRVAVRVTDSPCFSFTDGLSSASFSSDTATDRTLRCASFPPAMAVRSAVPPFTAVRVFSRSCTMPFGSAIHSTV